MPDTNEGLPHRETEAFFSSDFLNTDTFRAAFRGAIIAATHSHDPQVKVGAATIVKRRLVIGWNRLPSGYRAAEGFWSAQSERQLLVTHAEVAVCSQILPFAAQWLITTRKPCPQCLLAIAASRISMVFYTTEGNYPETERVASAHGVRLHRLPEPFIFREMPTHAKQTEWDFLTETLGLLQGQGEVSLPFVTAQFQPFSSKDRPDLMFIPPGEGAGAVFVEFKLVLPKPLGGQLAQILQEHATFAQSDSEVPIRFLFATSSTIPKDLKDQLARLNIDTADNLATAALLADAILECSQK